MSSLKDPEALAQSIEEVECKMAFQDESIDILNQQVIDQQKQIDRLVRLVEKLQQQIFSLQQNPMMDPSAEPPPPHY